jgi:NADH pyrophosphatase NudC (nudix superfamily)
MSEDDGRRRMTRFFHKYPLEYMFVFQIVSKFNEIYDHMYSGSQFNSIRDREIKMTVVRRPDNNTISMNEEAVVFVGALSGVITERILSFLGSKQYQDDIMQKAREAAKEYVKQVNPNLLQNYRKCLSCRLDNDYKNKFCGECGTKLPEP